MMVNPAVECKLNNCKNIGLEDNDKDFNFLLVWFLIFGLNLCVLSLYFHFMCS